MSDHRYAVDITLHSPGELELVLRDALPENAEQQEPRLYRRRFIGVQRHRYVIRVDIPLLPLEESDVEMFDAFTERLYQDQRLKLYPDLEN